jgi:hypothetical protein
MLTFYLNIPFSSTIKEMQSDALTVLRSNKALDCILQMDTIKDFCGFKLLTTFASSQKNISFLIIIGTLIESCSL